MDYEEKNRATIKENDFVIYKNGEKSRLVQVSNNKPVFIWKEKVYLSNAIGKPFGSAFELNQQRLHLITQEDPNNVNYIEVELSNVLDNRSLIDDGKSQKLTKDEIEVLKSKGCHSTEIVKTIVENSSSFKEKTKFSQEKYIKKKHSKYSNIVTILSPTIRLLTEMYFSQGPLKLCNMRIDSLSQMLSYANILPNGSYIVVDDCLGLLVAAVLERIGENGHIIQVYPGEGPVSSFRQAVKALNKPENLLLRILHGIPFGKAVNSSSIKNQSEVAESDRKDSLEKMDQSFGKLESNNSSACQNEPPLRESNTESLGKSIPENNLVQNKYTIKDDTVKKNVEQKNDAKFKRKEERQLELDIATKFLKANSLDGLLICCHHHPSSVVLPLLPFLSYSRPFAIHSSCLTPLVDCYKKLKESEIAIFLNISENFLRNYQVLPNRTHPYINMSNAGGYLLTGIRVKSSKIL